jgi:ankyrin repeat protein
MPNNQSQTSSVNSHIAILLNGNLEQVKNLVATGIDLNTHFPQQRNGLHYAAWNKDSEVIAYLLKQASIDINAKDNEGLTPLDRALHGGTYDTICKLIDYGATYELAAVIAKLKKHSRYELVPAIEKYIVNANTAKEYITSEDKNINIAPMGDASSSIRSTLYSLASLCYNGLFSCHESEEKQQVTTKDFNCKS